MDELFIGVEIGATKCQASLGTAKGELLHTRLLSVVLEEGAEGILRWMQKNVAELIAVGRDGGNPVVSIAVGFGGIIESATGRILTSVQVKGWQDCMLRDWFQGAFGLPAVILNDTVAGGYGEYMRGCGKGTHVFFYTNIGSGIGGCLVIDGACYDGLGYGAAYFGHTYIPDWTAAQPGARRKVEDMCSGWSIERRLRTQGYVPNGSLLLELCGGKRETLRCAMLEKAARQGDPFALAEIERTADSLATGLSNVITLFSPECVAIGGGVANMGDVLLDPVRRLVAERVFISAEGRYRIVQCIFGDQVVLVGALMYAAKETALRAG
jgi:glucokinase